MQKIMMTLVGSLLMIAAHAQGVANVSHSSVKGNVEVTGAINAKHGNFAGDLSIASDNAVLSASSVKGSITMKAKNKNPVLELYCGTTVLGDITFKNYAGIIKKSADSIIKGKVINGSIETVTTPVKCD